MTPRLSESTLPLRQISLDSVHEKSVRHGHISTLHIWPARRPLAASRAMLLATLLPDPRDAKGRRRVAEQLAGHLVPKRLKGGEEDPKLKETSGGILHWGRQDGPQLNQFRVEIKEAFGGRAPRVLDPFAGGGAIPLESMRLGCETFASDLNPVAWFILRCTLHYPRLVGREERPLPDFAIRDREFATALVKSRGARTKTAIRNALARLGHEDGGPVQLTSDLLAGDAPTKADFAWHLRAWGLRVLCRARRELADKYPTYAHFEPVKRKGRSRSPVPAVRRYKHRPPSLLEPDENGRASTDTLNAEFDSLYLEGRHQSSLGAQAGRRLPVGTHGKVWRMPGRDPAIEDTMAVQEARKADTPHANPARRRRRRIRRGDRCSSGIRLGGTEAEPRQGIGGGDDERQRRRVSALRCGGHHGGIAPAGTVGRARHPADRRDC